MKILYITSSLNEDDGWGRYSSGLIKEVSKTNEVFVICNSLHEILGVHQEKGLHSPLSTANPLKIFLASKRIQNIADSFKPDVVHFLVESYVLILPFLNFSKDTKTFLTVHGTYSFIPQMFIGEKIKLLIVSPLIKKAYLKLDGIISVSSFTKDYLLNQYKNFYKEDFDHNKIVVISNGIDLSSFPLVLNKKSNSQKSIIFVGAIKRRKGILEAINSLAEYRTKFNSNFVYTIVGSYNDNDGYIKEVKSRIQKLGLETSVVFTGFVNQEKLRSLYATADLFLMLSIQSGLSIEGFGLVYLEANAHGVAVIGSRHSGASDAIVDGLTGYLVDPLDSKEVSEKIHSILDNNSIKIEDCISWAKKQNIKDKAELVLSYYRPDKY